MSVSIASPKGVVGTKPRSTNDALISHPWIYFPLHGDTLSDDTATQAYDRAYAVTNGQASALFTNGLATVAGTTTNIWSTNAGWLTPSGDNYIQDTSAALQAFCAPASISGFLIMFRYQFGALPSGGEYIFSYSPGNSTTGGIGAYLSADGKIYYEVRAFGGVSQIIVTRDLAAASVDTEYTQCVYFDYNDLSAISFKDGVIQTSPNAIPTPLPTLFATHGMVIAARSQGGTPTSPLNSKGSGMIIRDMILVSATSDISASVAEIASQYTNNPSEIPRKLTEV